MRIVVGASEVRLSAAIRGRRQKRCGKKVGQKRGGCTQQRRERKTDPSNMGLGRKTTDAEDAEQAADDRQKALSGSGGVWIRTGVEVRAMGSGPGRPWAWPGAGCCQTKPPGAVPGGEWLWGLAARSGGARAAGLESAGVGMGRRGRRERERAPWMDGWVDGCQEAL